MVPHRWTYRIDVDGDGRPDTVIVQADRDLHELGQYEFQGHYTVTVRFASGGSASRKLADYGYRNFASSRWSPYFGASRLGRGRGEKLLLGESSGASSAGFWILVARSGHLDKLSPPPPSGWEVNSDATESNAFKCTRSGLQVRGFGQLHDQRHWIWTVATYRPDGTGWRRTRFIVHRRTSPMPPSYVDKYGTFLCPGLTRMQL